MLNRFRRLGHHQYDHHTMESYMLMDYSNHPLVHKHAAFHSMINRALAIPMSERNLSKEKSVIKSVAASNGYGDLVDTVWDKFLRKKAGRKFREIIDEHQEDFRESKEVKVLAQSVMKKFLQDILDKVIGLECIVIADRDGVPLIKVSDDKIPETALMPSFLSTFGLASLQGTKLGMGESVTSICMYGSYQVVQMDLEGLSLTFVGSTDCNTGHIMAVSHELSPILLELKTKTELDASQP